ncbi:MAG: hypothetical protein EXS17_00575 [Phycisphaerales bacterium]|nr:hypothetical protein [Phycisphaerales bacterium]
MTGTSIDAIDTAAVRISGRGLAARATLVGQATAALGDLTPRLRSAHRQDALTAGAFAALARDLALAHLAPLRELARVHGTPHLVVLHGQTLFHQPPLSLQLINASVVAHDLGCAVVSNLRAVDLAAGGQGAPITPLADWMLFRSKRTWRVIVNLGGFSNATVLPPQPVATSPQDSRAAWLAAVRGFDLCLCNQLLDHLARTRGAMPFDRDGNLARSGRSVPGPLQALHEILDAQRRAGRSLGTADEILALAAATLASLSPADALATAVEAIATTIAAAIHQHLAAKEPRAQAQVLVAGGGAKNLALVAALARCAALPVITTDQHDCPSDARESVAMALLGAVAHDGASITLAGVTGRTQLRVIDGEFLLARR